MAKKSKKENTLKGKQQKEEEEEARPMDYKKSKTLSSGKKSRAETAGIPAKTPTESITGTTPPMAENTDLHPTEEPFNVKEHAQKIVLA